MTCPLDPRRGGRHPGGLIGIGLGLSGLEALPLLCLGRDDLGQLLLLGEVLRLVVRRLGVRFVIRRFLVVDLALWTVVGRLLLSALFVVLLIRVVLELVAELELLRVVRARVLVSSALLRRHAIIPGKLRTNPSSACR